MKDVIEINASDSEQVKRLLDEAGIGARLVGTEAFGFVGRIEVDDVDAAVKLLEKAGVDSV